MPDHQSYGLMIGNQLDDSQLQSLLPSIDIPQINEVEYECNINCQEINCDYEIEEDKCDSDNRCDKVVVSKDDALRLLAHDQFKAKLIEQHVDDDMHVAFYLFQERLYLSKQVNWEISNESYGLKVLPQIEVDCALKTWLFCSP